MPPLIMMFFLAAAGGGYFYFFNPFWTHLDTRSFKTLVPVSSPTIRGWRGRQVLVHKDFLPLVEEMASFAEKAHLSLLVTSSFRQPEARLSDTIVRPASRSNHLAGHAIDLNIRYRYHLFESSDLRRASLPDLPHDVAGFITALRNHPGIRWGGDFTPEDPVHIDSGLNMTDPEAWDLAAAACLKDMESALPLWRTLISNR